MKPFESIRVLDLTHVLAGPFCTYQLAMLGAEVIKIESPLNPDMMRFSGSDEALADDGLGLPYLSQSAGKRAITLNLKTEAGQDILRTLVKESDVLVENYCHGALEALGLSYDHLSAVNPSLIYCSMTGFGHTGPKSTHPAYDNVIQAYSGLMDATGTEDSGPLKVGPPVLDYGTGAQAALAISAALYQRSHTGVGQHIDIAMLDCAMMLMTSTVFESAVTGEAPVKEGNCSLSTAGYAGYHTSDGYLVIGAFTRQQQVSLWEAIGDEAEADRVRSLSRQDIKAAIPEQHDRLQKRLMTQSAAHWEDILIKANVPAARVRTVVESLASEQVRSRQVIQSVDAPDTTLEATELTDAVSVTVAGFAYRHNGPQASGASPRVSQDTTAVLKELASLSDQDIGELKQQGVI